MNRKPADESLAKDVRTLLGMNVGDKRVLEQILRAARNGELVSNHERAYVDSLLAEHTDSVPKKDPPPRAGGRTASPPRTGSSPKTIAAVGGGVAAAIAVALLVLTMTPEAPDAEPAVDVPLPADVEPGPALTVAADSGEYGAGDFILVEGLSQASSGGAVELTITGPAGPVWSESVPLRDDGSFFTMALAGYGGWDAGTYALSAAHGEEMSELEFDFTASGR